ncbi:MAG: hypothetical protein AB8B66_01525 [Rickettsiaceae bacterium]
MSRPRKPESELTPEQIKRRLRNDRYASRHKVREPNSKPAILSLAPAPQKFAPQKKEIVKMEKTTVSTTSNKYSSVLDTVLNCPKLTLMSISIMSGGIFLGYSQFELYQAKGFNLTTSIFLAAIFEVWLILLASLNANKIRNLGICALVSYSCAAFYFGAENDINTETINSTAYVRLTNGLAEAQKSWQEAKNNRESGNMKFYYNEKVRYENELNQYSLNSPKSKAFPRLYWYRSLGKTL